MAVRFHEVTGAEAMKTINSEGGPFIAINYQDLHHWSGIYGLNFFKDTYPAETDYDAICELGLTNREDVIGIARGREIAMLFLELPLPTLIVEATADHIYIAQIETSEKGWSKTELRASDFEAATEWNHPMSLYFEAGNFFLFESSSNALNIYEDEYLNFRINEGNYTCEWSRQEWCGKAEMYFIRLMRNS